MWKRLVSSSRVWKHLHVCTVTLLQNNIAEVQDLQPHLLDEDLLEHILSLTQDTLVDMEVRYFAGGILAQLASRPQAWTLSEELFSTIVEQLVRVCCCGFVLRQIQTLGLTLGLFFCFFQHAAILTWTQIGREMVSYRWEMS